MKKIIYVLLIASLILVGCGQKAKEQEEDDGMYKNPIATIKFQGLGEMKFELQINEAPQSVFNFVELANEGYYDGLTMHRIIQNFVAQGGDPTGTGTGGPGYSIKGEFLGNDVENRTGHELGSIAFARSQMPDSAGSQFYIVLTEFDERMRSYMDTDYAAFGHMIEGQEVLEEINNNHATTADNGIPVKELIIESVSVDTLDQQLPSPEKLK